MPIRRGVVTIELLGHASEALHKCQLLASKKYKLIKLLVLMGYIKPTAVYRHSTTEEKNT